MSRSTMPRRNRVGRVSFFEHHGSWYLYHRAGGKAQRRRIDGGEPQAEYAASLLNARLVAEAAGISFELPDQRQSHGSATGPIVGDLSELCRRFLDHHERVLGSSVATVARYRSALRHLESFARSSSTASSFDG